MLRILREGARVTRFVGITAEPTPDGKGTIYYYTWSDMPPHEAMGLAALFTACLRELED